MRSDMLTAEDVLPLLATGLGRPYLYVESCPSTQDLLEPGAPEGAVAVADHQTAGRGRRGRTWSSIPGAALLCSVLLRPAPQRRRAEISLLGGLAVARAVEQVCGVQATVKWPNDVLVRDRKLAGVLAEGRGESVVLGIGVNVNHELADFPSDVAHRATSLRLVTGGEHRRAPLLAAMLGELHDLYEAWCKEGIASASDELTRRDALRGRRVAVDGVQGVAVGIDPDGRLLVDTDGGLRAVESGEVSPADPGW